MARFSAAFPNWTPVAVADSTTFSANAYHAIKGVVDKRFEIREISLGGLATVSAPSNMTFGRDSVVGVGPTAGRFAAMDALTSAPASLPTSFQTVSTTHPSRDAATGMLVPMAYNAFGGLTRWVPGPDEVISIFSNVQPLGEVSLSAYTGGSPGAMTSLIVVDVI